MIQTAPSTLRTYWCERDRYKFRSDVEICPLCRMLAAPFSKHRNVVVDVDGVKFRSKWEAEYHGQLMLGERAGAITDLQRQVTFSLDVPGIDGKTHHIANYVADHVFKQDGELKVQDSKGRGGTPEFKLKKKLMLACHGIEVDEVRRPHREARRRRR